MQELVFERPILFPPESAGQPWELAADWRILWRGKVYQLPMGFGTDGASIPRALWRICGTPLDVPRLYAALVHDYVYSGGCPEMSRADADALYREMLVALGIPSWKARIEWLALRLFGRSHWNNNGEAESSPLQ